jgi:hypothetical protein
MFSELTVIAAWRFCMCVEETAFSYADMYTLNKQSRTADKGCSFGLGLPTVRTQLCVAEYGVKLLNRFNNL